MSELEAKPVRKSWRDIFGPALFYGQTADRARKAKARVGLCIAVFVLIYGVIAARLAMLAMTPEHQIARRSQSQDRTTATRPDIMDRYGQLLATDINAPSLYAEPRRI